MTEKMKCTGQTLAGNPCRRVASVGDRCPDHGGRLCGGCGVNPIQRRARTPSKFSARTEEFSLLCKECQELIPRLEQRAKELAKDADERLRAWVHESDLPSGLVIFAWVRSGTDAYDLWGAW